MYYLALTLAGVPRSVAQNRNPSHTFAVLIPAHNEEGPLPATLRSVFALDYPPDMVRVYVVADNCADGTAAVAAGAGVMCLVRDAVERGKGFAVAFGLAAVAADGADAVLVLDADCQIDPGAMRALDAAFAAGAEAAQLSIRSSNADDGPAGYAAAIGSEIDDRIEAGLDRLGRSVPLRGTGMAFRMDVFDRVPWAAFTAVEDAEYAARLRAGGVRVRRVSGVGVSCAAPRQVSDLCRQRRRWRAALRAGAWAGLPVRVLRSKPLVLTHLLVTSVAALTGGDAPLVGWALGLVGLTAALYLRAVAAVGLSWRRAQLLLAAPVVVARLAWLTAAGLGRRRQSGWEAPTDRVRDAPAARASAAAGPAHPVFARRPAWVVRMFHRPFVRDRNGGAPFVSLTFDDGPHPVHTPAVLDRLGRYGVPATFFLVGERVVAAPRLPGTIAAAGHALGNHTFAHPRFWGLALADPLREIGRCQELVPEASSFRPPFGRLTPGVWLAARRLGLPVVTWSVDSGDWRCRTAAEAVACARQVLELVRPGDIVLLHDDRPWVELILDVLLPDLAQRGLLESVPGPVRERSAPPGTRARPARASA